MRLGRAFLFLPLHNINRSLVNLSVFLTTRFRSLSRSFFLTLLSLDFLLASLCWLSDSYDPTHGSDTLSLSLLTLSHSSLAFDLLVDSALLSFSLTLLTFRPARRLGSSLSRTELNLRTFDQTCRDLRLSHKLQRCVKVVSYDKVD